MNYNLNITREDFEKIFNDIFDKFVLKNKSDRKIKITLFGINKINLLNRMTEKEFKEFNKYYEY